MLFELAKLSASSIAIGSIMRESCRVRTMLPLLPLDAKRTHEILRSPRELTSTCCDSGSMLLLLVLVGSALDVAIEAGLRPRPVTLPTSVKAFGEGAGAAPPEA